MIKLHLTLDNSSVNAAFFRLLYLTMKIPDATIHISNEASTPPTIAATCSTSSLSLVGPGTGTGAGAGVGAMLGAAPSLSTPLSARNDAGESALITFSGDAADLN